MVWTNKLHSRLLDAYPSATNVVRGIDSNARGVMHAKQVIEQYEAEEAVFKHKAILININRSVLVEKDVYESVRYAWKLDAKKARKAELVLAVEKGLIVGVFAAEDWLEALPENFPGTPAERLVAGRWGFNGRQASKDISDFYLRRRLPESMRKRGAAFPIKYTF